MADTDRYLEGRAILVVEDVGFTAHELATELLHQGAVVVGPAPSLSDASRLAGSTTLHGAILDVRLRDEVVFPVAEQLVERGVPTLPARGGQGVSDHALR